MAEKNLNIFALDSNASCGHFAAMEEPELLAEDIEHSIDNLEPERNSGFSFDRARKYEKQERPGARK